MAAQQPALQLTDVAHGEQKGWRRNSHLVDSLPYVDSLAPAEKAAVDKLIEEEVRRGADGRDGRHGRRLPPVPLPVLLLLLRSPCLLSPMLRNHSPNFLARADARQQQEAVRLPGRAAAPARDAVQGAAARGGCC